MKKIFKLLFLLILYFLFLKENSFSYEINDSWNIYKNIDNIDWYKWEYWNNNLWFLWINNNVLIDWKTVYWYFDKNKKTVVKKIDIDFLYDLWYLWNINSVDFNNIDFEIIKWLFDKNKTTKIIKTDAEYNFYLWYLWNVKIQKSITWRKKDKVLRSKSYKWLLYEYLSLNLLTYALENNISLNEFNKFISNIIELIIQDNDIILYWNDIEEAKKEIVKTNFLINMKVLVKKSKKINFYFKNLKTKQEKIYLLYYYLN
jgi:hypothetical protein